MERLRNGWNRIDSSSYTLIMIRYLSSVESSHFSFSFLLGGGVFHMGGCFNFRATLSALNQDSLTHYLLSSCVCLIREALSGA